jgi:hypothetical protein
MKTKGEEIPIYKEGRFLNGELTCQLSKRR